MNSHSWLVVALGAAFYIVLAFAASIFGSYRYEPSGIQYIFLPWIAAPVALIVAIALAVALGSRAPATLRSLPFLAVLLFLWPGVNLPGDRGLEIGRWLTILVGVGHAILLVRTSRRGVDRTTSNVTL